MGRATRMGQEGVTSVGQGQVGVQLLLHHRLRLSFPVLCRVPLRVLLRLRLRALWWSRQGAMRRMGLEGVTSVGLVWACILYPVLYPVRLLLLLPLALLCRLPVVCRVVLHFRLPLAECHWCLWGATQATTVVAIRHQLGHRPGWLLLCRQWLRHRLRL